MRLEYFEMIDRVVAFDRDARHLEARSIVPDASPVFEGHFPGHPLVPGVLLTETMAQASGYLVLGLMDFSHMPFLMAVDKAFGIKLPLEQWTQEVNEGKVPAEEYFVLKNLVARVDDLVAAKSA